MKFRKQFEDCSEYDVPEIYNYISKTEPNMALTPQQVLERFATNRPVEFSNNMHYTGEEYYPDIAGMDLVEIDQLMIDNQTEISHLRSEIEQAKQRKKDLEDKTVSKNDTQAAETVG